MLLSLNTLNNTPSQTHHDASKSRPPSADIVEKPEPSIDSILEMLGEPTTKTKPKPDKIETLVESKTVTELVEDPPIPEQTTPMVLPDDQMRHNLLLEIQKKLGNPDCFYEDELSELQDLQDEIFMLDDCSELDIKTYYSTSILIADILLSSKH